MQSIRRFAHQNPNSWIALRSFSTSDSSSLRKNVASLLDSLSLKPGGTVVQNCGDSEVGKVVIELAKERKLQSISIIDDKPGSPEIIEELKVLGGDIVVPESYTKTWYMKRLVGELSPAAGLNFSDGYQATAVCKAVTNGGTFLTYGKKLPKFVAYDGAARKPVEWSEFLKEKKLKVLNICHAIESPQVTVVHSEPDFEIRLYGEFSWISASVLRASSFEKATQDGFHRLYQYMHDAYTNSSQLKKTAPILTSIIPASPQSSGSRDYFVRSYMSVKFEAATGAELAVREMGKPMCGSEEVFRVC